MIVKICGIQSLDIARVALESGADLLGFMFYLPSPRYIPPETAAAIIRELPTTVRAVGVFVNESAAHIQGIAEECRLDIIQVHGEEAPELLATLKQSYAVIKAISLQNAEDLELAARYPDTRLLIDTPCPDRGGSGLVGNWELARELACTRDILLAGGLTPDNVAAAIRTVRPAGVDVSSGVESSRGQKDSKLIKRFLAAARAAERDI